MRFTNFRRPPGVAWMTAVLVGMMLTLLAVAVILLGTADTQGQRRQQQSLQAYWNARSGLALFLKTGTLPDPDRTGLRVWDLGTNNRCLVSEDPATQDLVFEGSCGAYRRRLLCPKGNPGRLVEIP